MSILLKLILLVPALMAEEYLVSESQKEMTESTIYPDYSRVVDLSEVPFLVSINIFNRHVCTGTILNKYMVLTALHCTMWGVINDIQIRAGSSNPRKNGQTIQVKGTCTYANNNELDGYRDIQILILEKPLVYGDEVQSVTVSFDDLDEDTTAIAIGWNIIQSENETKPLGPQKIQLTKMADEDCPGNGVDKSMACFSGNLEKMNNIKTGGPILVNGKQVGIDGYSSRSPCDDNRGLYILLNTHRSYISKCMAYNVPSRRNTFN